MSGPPDAQPLGQIMDAVERALDEDVDVPPDRRDALLRIAREAVAKRPLQHLLVARRRATPRSRWCCPDRRPAAPPFNNLNER